MTQRPVRKLLALLLSLLLVLAFMPTALAEGQDAPGGNPPAGGMDPAEDPNPTTVVAQIGDTKYQTLAEAFNAAVKATQPVTIVLLKNASASELKLSDAKAQITLDLGGFTVTDNAIVASARGLFQVTDGASLKVVGPGKIESAVRNAESNHCFRIERGASVDIDANVTVSTYGVCVFIRDLNSTLTTAGDLTSQTNFAISGNGTQGLGDTIVTISGGSVTTEKDEGFAIYQPQSGTLNISGGAISGDNCIGIKSGTLNITGGTLNATGAYVADVQPNSDGINSSGSAIMIDANNAYVGDVQINITGGKITSQKGDAVREVGEGDNLVSINVSGDAELSAPTAGRNDISVTNDHADTETSKVSVTSGTFSKYINDRYLDDNALSIKSGDNYYVGDAAKEEIASAADGETIEVLNGTEITGVPEGVKVTNKTEGTITVDGTEVEKNEDYTVPVTPKPEPSKPSTSFTEPSYYPDYDEDVEYLPPVEDEEEEEPLYMVTCRTLNVRMGPGTSYAKLGTMSRGTIVSGELEDGWVKFTYNGVTAYSSADYLMKVDGDLSGLHVTCRTLNVRAGAGTNFQILGTLSRGTEISVRDVLPGWYEIDFLGGIGYVSSAYIG